LTTPSTEEKCTFAFGYQNPATKGMIIKMPFSGQRRAQPFVCRNHGL
jgi:hypothetical protein